VGVGVVATATTTATTAVHAFCATGVGVSVNKTSKFGTWKLCRRVFAEFTFSFGRGRWDGVGWSGEYD